MLKALVPSLTAKEEKEKAMKGLRGEASDNEKQRL